ncbi:class I SAM-dependent methyltransferase (plasmid) [Leisingera sp. S132]|uniref:class I SAM-dependent methyltransferase n=1 Tax=Leisingera sp. S132 TaxID=2867016 RepID=UPI0021A6D682|nr:class I SAM-dependent methyltransferase [Leisingera sp. S132]UWQ81878.1 class I SAM-dependent methyltransferase [Leisingera sp. S132]
MNRTFTRPPATRPPARPSVLTACRCCRSSNLMLVLPMGAHPPANMFVRPEDRARPQPAFALNAQACLDCGLLQVADQVPPDFFTNYLYVPSGAATMHSHFAELAQVAVARAGSGEGAGLIVDIGCNDGLMLSHANAQGGRTLGIDPAANLAVIAAERGVRVDTAFFNPETAARVRAAEGPARVITTTNTFNHIDDLHGFCTGVLALLEEDGTFIIEVPWGKTILETNEFDNVYHEHLSELSLLSIVRLGEAVGLDVVDVTRLPVHGGSMRVFLQPAALQADPAPVVAQMLEEERAAGLLRRESYEAFAGRVQDLGEVLTRILKGLKASGKSIAGYGAPAKGNTLLNYFGIGPETLDFLADRNPLKQGLYSPGMMIPVLGPEAVAERQPDYLLVLAWNFFDEIREQMAEFEARGGKFIVPLPSPRIIP